MYNKKIAIIGASGFIGHHISRYLSTQHKNLLTPTRQSLNIEQYKDWERFLLDEKPVFLILLAGCKDIKKLEQDASYAYKINTQPVLDYIDIVQKNNIKTKLIYFSSDYVFDGTRGKYTSDDIPNPQTNYGKSKLESEMALIRSKISYKIIRTSSVMAGGGVFYEWLKKSLIEDKEVCMFDNVYFTPTDINFLSQKINEVILNFDKIKQNIIHIVGDTSYSRYEYACFFKNTLPNANANVVKIKLDIAKSTFSPRLTMLCDDIFTTKG